MTINDRSFSFKENLDNDDDQLKLPDELFNKFKNYRKTNINTKIPIQINEEYIYNFY